MSAWCLSVGGVELRCVRMASCVSVLSRYLLLRPRMSFQSLEGFVLNVVSSSICFHLVCCSCLISSSISVFKVLILSKISGVGSCLRSCLRNSIFCFMAREYVGL